MSNHISADSVKKTEHPNKFFHELARAIECRQRCDFSSLWDIRFGFISVKKCKTNERIG